MTTLVPIDNARFKHMERVAELKLMGYTDREVAKEVGLKYKEVQDLFSEYRQALSEDAEARDIARDHLHQMIKHYDMLIKKFYDLVNEIDGLSFSHQVAGQKNSALKAIAELEAKRLDALQKAGILDNTELGNELADMEEKQAILISILQDDLCPSCRLTVSNKLMKVTGKVQPIETIEAEVVK